MSDPLNLELQLVLVHLTVLGITLWSSGRTTLCAPHCPPASGFASWKASFRVAGLQLEPESLPYPGLLLLSLLVSEGQSVEYTQETVLMRMVGQEPEFSGCCLSGKPPHSDPPAPDQG